MKINNYVSVHLKENSKVYMILKSRMVQILYMKIKKNKIAECNLLHDILNSSKLNKRLNIQYSPIIHGCINTRKGRA